MVAQIDKLRATAKERAGVKGHRLSAFRHHEQGAAVLATAECVWCGLTATLRTDPVHGFPNIGGAATERDCCRVRDRNPERKGRRQWYMAYMSGDLRAAFPWTGGFDYSRPCVDDFPAYTLIVGPFATKRGAQYAAAHQGWATVAEAEHRARDWAARSRKEGYVHFA